MIVEFNHDIDDFVTTYKFGVIKNGVIVRLQLCGENRVKYYGVQTNGGVENFTESEIRENRTREERERGVITRLQ
jgi:hypothetical protein